MSLIYCCLVSAKPLKNNSFVFSVVLSRKTVQIQILKLNISRTAWRILTILVSFCRILHGLLDETNLFWRCSSPLRPLLLQRFTFTMWNSMYCQAIWPSSTVAVMSVCSLKVRVVSLIIRGAFRHSDCPSIVETILYISTKFRSIFLVIAHFKA